MKYVDSRNLMMLLPQSITKLGVSEAETVDAALTMCADTLPKIEQEFKVTVDFATFKSQLLKTMGELLYKHAECPYECLKNPCKHVEEEHHTRNHIKLPLWPKRMQKNNAENFFLMEYILTYVDILFRYLPDAGISQEQANLIATNALDQLALWVDENCIRKCGYVCIRCSESSGYCTLRSYVIQPLACPNKKEVTLRQLGVQEEDLVCMRRELKQL